MEDLEVLEGTWEELAAHAEAFKGRRLRLIVLPADEATLREVAERLLAEADHLEREPGKPGGDAYKTAFSEIITEKYRKMALKL